MTSASTTLSTPVLKKAIGGMARQGDAHSQLNDTHSS